MITIYFAYRVLYKNTTLKDKEIVVIEPGRTQRSDPTDFSLSDVIQKH